MDRFDYVRLSTLSDALPYSYQALRYHLTDTELIPHRKSEKGEVLVPRDFALRVADEAENFNSLSQLLSAINYSYTHA
ncbi:hypothetical protein [Salinibacter altiplanensis]|uniref:hypothetical protein n=1 Tax=Salinibacter altiplanensis TaxID=1803181 RepID=UPI000C9EE02C|nr:hypothetical protein [Salinibacter altiplanensis]